MSYYEYVVQGDLWDNFSKYFSHANCCFHTKMHSTKSTADEVLLFFTLSPATMVQYSTLMFFHVSPRAYTQFSVHFLNKNCLNHSRSIIARSSKIDKVLRQDRTRLQRLTKILKARKNLLLRDSITILQSPMLSWDLLNIHS